MRLSQWLLSLSLAVLVTGSLSAQRPTTRPGGFGGGGGGIGFLLQNEGVQKELKLEKKQIDEVKEATDRIREKNRDEFAKLRDLKEEERTKKQAELSKKVSEDTLKAISSVLSEGQVKRLKQIELQSSRTQAFTREDVQKALSLKTEQVDKIKAIQEDTRKAMTDLFGGGGGRPDQEKMDKLRKETTEKVQAVLTDDQKKTWKEMVGEPFELRLQFGGGTQPRRPNQN